MILVRIFSFSGETIDKVRVSCKSFPLINLCIDVCMLFSISFTDREETLFYVLLNVFQIRAQAKFVAERIVSGCL